MDIGTDNHGQDWDDWRQVGGGETLSPLLIVVYTAPLLI